MARMEAVWRIAAFFYAWLASLVAVVGSVLGLVFGLVDVTLVLLLDRSLDENGTIGKWAYRLIMWPIKLTNYALFGKGRFMWTP